jgi:hypothetical protein
VQEEGFVKAKRLARSDLLKDAEGRQRRIVRISERRGRFTVYNFTVEKTHTYYAGAGRLWVHNADTCTELAVHELTDRGDGWIIRVEPSQGAFLGPSEWNFHEVWIDPSGGVVDPMQYPGYQPIPFSIWSTTPTPDIPYPDQSVFSYVDPDRINQFLP